MFLDDGGDYDNDDDYNELLCSLSSIRFFITADDKFELWAQLLTNPSASSGGGNAASTHPLESLTMIMSQTAHSNWNQWEKYPSQQISDKLYSFQKGK